MTITKKRPQPLEPNLIRAKGSCDGSAGFKKKKQWAKTAKKTRKW